MNFALWILVLVVAWVVIGFLSLLFWYYLTPPAKRWEWDPMGEAIISSMAFGPITWWICWYGDSDQRHWWGGRRKPPSPNRPSKKQMRKLGFPPKT